jgi:hypothetical protein
VNQLVRLDEVTVIVEGVDLVLRPRRHGPS